MSLATLLLGRTIANNEAEGRKIGALEGVPAMGLDGLGSAAYGPEAMLTVLAVCGAAGLSAIGPITAVILLLLLVVFVSYRQTIVAYPRDGGAYTVSRENLGPDAGLLAAAALMVDYMLNVAVGISAGIGALTSAVPSLHAYTLPLCLAVLAIVTMVNLRGTKESGLAFAVPTYVFIAALALVLLVGIWRMVQAGGSPQPVIPPPPLAPPQAASLWLLLRAFAAGCTAMTGVEAVSNGVGAFREPRVRYAHRTLTAIVVTLGALLVGIALVARAYGISAMDESEPGYRSVLSQITEAVFGRGVIYGVTIAAVLAVLCLSANTSFVGFPRLCRQVAADAYLPRLFAQPGRRLVFTAGILFLTAGAGLLLLLFGGITDKLIPLFAVGAFLSFTMSQAGMAMHWHRNLQEPRARTRRLINGTGAAATAAALIIILVAKFTEGAWLTAVVIPLTLLLLRVVRRYYDNLDLQLLAPAERALDLSAHAPPLVVIPIGRWDRVSQNGLGFALRLSPDVVALHCTELGGPDVEERIARMEEQWRRDVQVPAEEAGIAPPRLVIEPSPFRSLLGPLLRQIATLRRTCPERPVAIVLPLLVEARWWERLLHTGRERRLRRSLLRHAGPDLAVVGVPWQLQPVDPGGVPDDETE